MQDDLEMVLRERDLALVELQVARGKIQTLETLKA
jgi:hypothetical protein